MTKSNEIKMTYEQIQQLAGYLEHLRGNIETVNQKTHFFKRNPNQFNKAMGGSGHVKRSVREYVEASVTLNEQTIATISLIEQALLNSNDKDKVDELFGVKK